MVASIQTFGSALNFHPQVHALVTEGALERRGAYLPLTAPDLAALEELLRRLVLAELVKAQRPARANFPDAIVAVHDP